MNNKKVGIGIGAALLVIILLVIILILGLKEKTTYKVTFDSGNNSINEVIEVDENGTVSKPTDPTKEGYVFEGWYYNGEKFDFSSKITDDIVLKAKWTSVDVKKWTITFDSNGGNDVDNMIIENGQTIKSVPEVEREGYTFVGWFYNNQEFDFDTVITKNITLKAKWQVEDKPVSGTTTPTTVKYSVKFDSNGGTSVKTQTVIKNGVAKKPGDPVRAGYTFVGWYNDNVLYNFSSKVIKNITLTAKWEKAITKYTVTFDTDGGNQIASQTVESGKTATKPTNPIKEGYTFVGWYNGNTEFDFATTISSNITLTAKYTKDVVVSYVIEDVPNTLYKQAKLYILKNGEKVKGTIDITNDSNETITKKVEASGLDIVKDIYTYSNPKAAN